MSKKVKVINSQDVPLKAVSADHGGPYHTKRILTKTSTGSKNVAMGLAFLNPGEHHDWHKWDCDDCFFVLKGNGTVYWNNKKIKFKEGDFVFLPAGLRNKIAATGKEQLKIVWAISPPPW